MKFSIIVPVYNVEKYLPRCLDSVLDQEFDDYEIIAVDDESPDNSIDILNEYQKKTEKLFFKTIFASKDPALSAFYSDRIEHNL